MVIPEEGSVAPDFELNDQGGNEVRLSGFKGKSAVILYFYPKDDTPGCTVEACEFRDNVKNIGRRAAVVLGVSPDDGPSHQKFIQKFNLPFALLSDTEKKVCQSYGVWVKKRLYGREYMGVARTTFVIGKDGRIRKVFENVKPQGHAAQVVEVLTSG